MIDYEFALRAAAVVAAAALVATPSVVAYAQAAVAWITAKQPVSVTVAKTDDAHTVVEIARRLQAAGNKRGVELCQQLLDCLLTPEATKK